MHTQREMMPRKSESEMINHVGKNKDEKWRWSEGEWEQMKKV